MAGGPNRSGKCVANCETAVLNQKIEASMKHCILIANIASPTSVRHIDQHAAVCLSCVDVFAQKG